MNFSTSLHIRFFNRKSNIKTIFVFNVISVFCWSSTHVSLSHLLMTSKPEIGMIGLSNLSKFWQNKEEILPPYIFKEIIIIHEIQKTWFISYNRNFVISISIQILIRKLQSNTLIMLIDWNSNWHWTNIFKFFPPQAPIIQRCINCMVECFDQLHHNQ